MWLVPADAPGVRIVETWDHLGMRASGSHDVVLEDVVVPPDHAVDVRPPREWAAGPDPVQAAWNVALISAIYDGIARSARDWVVRHVKERTPTNLGAPLSTLPRVQESVGEIEALLAVNRRLLSGLAADVQAGSPPPPPESGLIKLTVTGNAIRAVEAGLALVGNAGLSRKNPLERHYRDVLCGRVHTPQDDSTRIAAGRAALER
jgi:alkylation response protein AidB-like acyl-CoA dehydrogenase